MVRMLLMAWLLAILGVTAGLEMLYGKVGMNPYIAFGLNWLFGFGCMAYVFAYGPIDPRTKESHTGLLIAVTVAMVGTLLGLFGLPFAIVGEQTRDIGWALGTFAATIAGEMLLVWLIGRIDERRKGRLG